MSIKRVLQIGNEALRLKSKSVNIDEEDVSEIITDLQDTLRAVKDEKGIGRGIAAPQIGVLKRIIYAECGNKEFVMINPEITSKSKETFEVWDSCFSADIAFFGMTVRHKYISVIYINDKGERVSENFSDDLSELFQHEIDHLNGILFTDRIIGNKIIMRGEWEKIKENPE